MEKELKKNIIAMGLLIWKLKKKTKKAKNIIMTVNKF